MRKIIEKRGLIESLVVIACVLFGVGSLGSSCDSSSWKVSDADFSESKLCSETAKMLCNDIYTCCAQNQIEQVFDYQISSEHSDCKRDVERACALGLHEFVEAFSLGTAVLNVDETNACWDELFRPRSPCVKYNHDPHNYISPCSGLAYGLFSVDGTVEAEGDCFDPIECVEGTFCDMDHYLCIPYSALGQSCNNIDCVDGLRCGYDVEDYICMEYVAIGEECTDSDECAPDAYCDMYSDPPLPVPVCTSVKADDSPCTPDTDECENSCLRGMCNDNRTHCADDFDCPDGGLCDPTPVCGLRPWPPIVIDHCEEAIDVLYDMDIWCWRCSYDYYY
ncbi:MAG: hypothetical protein GY762_08240 [Proteobacteria bacterium]|nr:hypothetical protein [Pseudomonadota bacterium]